MSKTTRTICDCGKPATRTKNNEDICQRCYDIEERFAHDSRPLRDTRRDGRWGDTFRVAITQFEGTRA